MIVACDGIVNNSLKVVAQNADDPAVAQLLVVQEDLLQGNTVDDDYASGDRVPCKIYGSGMRFYALVKSGNNVAVADKLGLNSDGKFSKTQDDGTTAIANPKVFAVEAVDASTADKLVLVEVI